MFLVPLPLGFVRRLIPPTPLSRRLASQSLLFASGDGAFLTISAFYLLEIVGLTSAKVGLALTIAAAFGLVLGWPIGRVIDRYGAQRLWWISGLGRTAAFVAFPFVDSFGSYLALALLFEVAEGMGRNANQAYVLDVMNPRERVRTQAFLYSALNVGFTVGAIIGGVALALKDTLGTTDVIRWAPLLSAVIMAANAYWITLLPVAPHDPRRVRQAAGGKSAGSGGSIGSGESARVDTPAAQRPRGGPSAWRNRGWMGVSFCNGVLWTNQVLLHTVIPLWLVERTDSPSWLLGWLFGTNTVLCIFVPPLLPDMPRDLGVSLRRVWISSVFFAAACAITFVTHDTRGLLTIFLVWLGHVAVTGAELAVSGASWAFQAELMDPQRRGDYQGVAAVFNGLAFAGAPALYTWLSGAWSGWGWAVIAGFIVLAAAGMGPAVRTAERFGHTHFPEHFTDPAEADEPGGGAEPSQPTDQANPAVVRPTD